MEQWTGGCCSTIVVLTIKEKRAEYSHARKAIFWNPVKEKPSEGKESLALA